MPRLPIVFVRSIEYFCRVTREDAWATNRDAFHHLSTPDESGISVTTSWPSDLDPHFARRHGGDDLAISQAVEALFAAHDQAMKSSVGSVMG